MTTPLSSSSVLSLYDQGTQYLSTNHINKSNLAVVDLKKILTAPNSQKIITSLPPQWLYLSLKSLEEEELVALFSCLNEQQWSRLVDYETWLSCEIVAKKMFEWLSICKQVSNKHLLTKLRALDEEYQIALMQPFIKGFAKEQFELLSTCEQDRLIALPGEEFFYRIDGDQATFDLLAPILASILETDLTYGISLIAHCSALPPNESELLALQFRNARLEEDGFITEEEALSYFSYTDPLLFRKKVGDQNITTNNIKNDSIVLKDSTTNKNFFEQCILWAEKNSKYSPNQLLELQHRSLILANALASAAKLETNNIKQMRSLLRYGVQVISLGLEFVVGHNYDQGLQLLIHNNFKVLFRLGMSLFYNLQQEILEQLTTVSSIDTVKLKKNYSYRKFGLILDQFDNCIDNNWDINTIECMKALFNRFPVLPKQQANLNKENKHMTMIFSMPTNMFEFNSGVKILALAIGSVTNNIRLKPQTLKTTNYELNV